MNILGHSYLATHTISGNKNLLIIGSLLPESFPFVPNNPFTEQEIHEGGEEFLDFLNKNYPTQRELALGILTHSSKFGVDNFNKSIKDYASKKREKVLKDIADCSKIDLQIAESRLHNFLWWGVEIWILKSQSEFVKQVGQVLKEVNVEFFSKLLSDCFQKDYVQTKRTFEILFKEIYKPKDLNSIEGLVNIWKRQAAGLPEHDEINIQQTAKVFEECADLFKDNWKSILDSLVAQVENRLKTLNIT